MDADSSKSACAPSNEATHWHGINWAECEHQVRRLQARIVKATRERKWGRVKALQHLLTHSFNGKAIAVRRVTQNQGKRTPGVDNVLWETPEAKSRAIRSLRRRGYQPLPLKRVKIPKSNGKMRLLGIPTMKDRAMQALHLLALVPVAEMLADKSSYGFRPERSTADAIGHCFTALAKKTSPEWILEGDIKSCFDQISHEWLLTHVPTDQVMLRKWLTSGFMELGKLYATEEGTPQGGIVSPTLANMALDGIEAELTRYFGGPCSTKATASKTHVVRYADDFIITGSSKELLENEIKPLVEKFLAGRGLTLSQEKTRITHISEGFDFLGQNVRKYDGKLIIKPSEKSVKAFMEKVRGIVRSNMTVTQVRLIALLNPVVRGWANYHRHVVSGRTFRRVDHEIWQLLWQWAGRRHPKKGATWIKQRYFARIGDRDWVFTAVTDPERSGGKARKLELVRAGDVRIQRHRLIKGAANPFDPEWEAYFEERLGLKMMGNLRGRNQLLSLWKQQGGRCVKCDQKITKETGWHVHHLIQRVHGGKAILSNEVMLHPNCHMQEHHGQGTNVEKPAPATGGYAEARAV